MKDDFTNLETGSSCYVLNSATSIYSYKGGIRKTYSQVGGKWYLSAQSNYYNIPDNAVCWSYSDITLLNSNSVYYPIYTFIAFILAFSVWYICFRLLSRFVRFRA